MTMVDRTHRSTFGSDLLITQSTIREWDRCKRKWWLSTYRRLAKTSEYRSPVTVGTLVHDGLSAYYESMYGDGDGIEHPIQYVRQLAFDLKEQQPEFADDITRDAELACVMLEGYMEWVEETSADADFERVEPERVVRAQLVPGITLMGKLDGKVLTRDGWTGFLEHKTVGNFVDLPAVAQIDRQLLTYDLLEYLEWLEQHGDDERPTKPLTDGAILNMLRKVKRTARAKPPFYARERVEHNIHELRNHWLHVVSIAVDISRAIERLNDGESHHRVAPPTPTFDCRWSCQFHDICPMFDDGSDVESVIAFEYEERDPLARYVDTTEDEA